MFALDCDPEIDMKRVLFAEMSVNNVGVLRQPNPRRVTFANVIVLLVPNIAAAI